MTRPDDSEFADAIEVVSGEPTPEELAAVVAVLLEASKQQSSTKSTQRSTWAKNDSILRTGIVVGNGQWGSQYKQGL
ncbi:Acyl-CoA carboxylase epsilon subunit [Microbacteriaceae bacterium]